MSVRETFEDLMSRRVSIARIGDCEFECLHGNSIPFQVGSEKLRLRLLEILGAENDRCLIGLQNYSAPRAARIRTFTDLSYADSCFAQVATTLIAQTNRQRRYGNAFVSRLPVFTDVGLERIRALWHGREVVLVRGDGGAFDCDPRLFDNWTRGDTILAPADNAFSEYGSLLAQCTNFERSRLFLISLGPTATVLAYDLSQLGYQALDIGHLPNCLHEFLGEAPSPEKQRKSPS